MYSHETQLRVRYSETDQMGFVYYGNYPQYYECGRVEAMRALGLSYARLETEEGVMMPILENYGKYLKPARYDELLTIRTHIPALPAVKMRFEYEVINEAGDKIHEGWSVLAFMKKDSGRPQRAPQSMLEALKPYFDEE